MIAIDKTNTVKPLKTVTVSTDEKNTVRVHDGQGRLYAEGTGPEFSFIVSGTLGHHAVAVLDTDGTELERSSFRVYCESGIEDESGQKISCGSDTTSRRP